MPDGINADYAVFVSFAERLRAGDQLYIDILGGKDPLYYYLLAGSRAISETGSVFLDFGWLLIASVAGSVILYRASDHTKRRAAALGFLVTPIIFTGAAYEPGYTHLPGSVLTMLAIGAFASQRYSLGASFVAMLAFFKLILLPVAVVGIMAFLPKGIGWPRAALAILAGGATAASVLVAMWMRGEGAGWAKAQMGNVAYSQGPVMQGGGVFWGEHLTRVLSPPAIVLLIVCGAVLIACRVDARRDAAPSRSVPLFRAGVATLAVATLVLALTGLWEHHGQAFAAPAAIAVLLAASRLPQKLSLQRIFLALIPLSYLLSGPISLYSYVESIERFPGSTQTFVGPSPEAIALTHLDGGAKVYARVGGSSDSGHARGLGSWTLFCPRPYQWYFDPPWLLESTATCVINSPVVIVDLQFAISDRSVAWGDYKERIHAALNSNYNCDEYSFGQICVSSSSDN